MKLRIVKNILTRKCLELWAITIETWEELYNLIKYDCLKVWCSRCLDQLTKEIRSILAISKPSSWFFGGKVDAVVWKISFGKRKLQVVVVSNIYKRIPKHKYGWNHLSLQEIEAQNKGREKEKETHQQNTVISHRMSATQLSLSLSLKLNLLGAMWGQRIVGFYRGSKVKDAYIFVCENKTSKTNWYYFVIKRQKTSNTT